MAFSMPATSLGIPSVSGGYTLKATSPGDNPATTAVEVAPGQTITVDATATITYAGDNMNSPPFTVNTELHLYKAGVEKATSSQAFDIASMALESGKTYDRSGSATITIPAGAEPGLYTLKAVASAEINYMGITKPFSAKELFVVDVIGPATATPASGQATPTPAPAPEQKTFGVNQSSVLTQGGQIRYKTGDVAGSANGASVAGSVDVNLTHVPDNGGLNMYVRDAPDTTTATQFMLAAASSGSDIKDIAYVLVVDKQNLTNGDDIRNATITMKVSKSWVDANGGIDAIKVLRYSDGISEALDTHYVGMDGDMMVFQALSPHGLSQFALAAVAQLPVTAAESAPVGVQVGASIIIGIIAVIIIVLVAIIGVTYVLRKRGQKKKKQE